MLYVLCLKCGDKYGPEYVNRLANAVGRHLSVPHTVVCFTDDASGIAHSIKTIKLPDSSRISGWWWKTYLFKTGIFSDSDVLLYFDLDMVIVDDITPLATYLPDEFLGMRDVYRVFRPAIHQLGSAVMRWQANTYSQIWTKFFHNPQYQQQFRGDQNWIWYLAKHNIKFYPDEWIRSYKWEVRTKQDLVKNTNGDWEFATTANPELNAETRVLAFHGTPAVHTVRDPIVVRNWR